MTLRRNLQGTRSSLFRINPAARIPAPRIASETSRTWLECDLSKLLVMNDEAWRLVRISWTIKSVTLRILVQIHRELFGSRWRNDVNGKESKKRRPKGDPESPSYI
jgi:hypothetical protein